MFIDNLSEKILYWRRDFHQHPELGFLEMRTASILADYLDKLGYDLKLGREVMEADEAMGMPHQEEIARHVEWARANGAKEEFLPYFKDGYTGIVATLDTNRKGPTVAFRVDMDALPIHETKDAGHLPNKLGFRSVVDGRMHACGHDAHMAIGLGLATLLKTYESQLRGVVKLIFQPAEEGTRGAKSMVEAGIVDDVDYFIALHVGTGVPHRHFVASNDNFLASSKIDVTFRGQTAHAGSEPEKGSNSLLAASTAVLNLHAISRHSSGTSRINVGEMQAGLGRNIIPNEAKLKIETRGETAEINEFMKEKVERIVTSAAAMYENELEFEIVGEAISSKCSPEFAEILHEVAIEHPFIEKSVVTTDKNAGSEDATYFMERVKEAGGVASYVLFGTDLAAGHHHEKFDINEETLLPAVEILFSLAKHLLKK